MHGKTACGNVAKGEMILKHVPKAFVRMERTSFVPGRRVTERMKKLYRKHSKTQNWLFMFFVTSQLGFTSKKIWTHNVTITEQSKETKSCFFSFF